ncbi:BtrH N-terminal domain-containing protein [Mycetocola sp. 2940]|uniref:BtrH N-terminal domain-containing protein n=1 Tax=Mycetocola sp. 2940 TaxID=3156452 RepID=UPI00339A5393
MTEQHSLKKRIRERMERTGESYTAAHRRILAERRHSGHPAAVTGYPAFGSDEHTPSALCRHMLAVDDIGVSEPMAFGLGGGIGFLYAVFEYRQVPHPLLTIVAQHHPQPWLDAVAGHLGLDLSTVTSSAPGAALKKLDAALDAGRPAMLTVGRGLLPWHGDTRVEEAADPYPIVVAGRADGRYLVDDSAPEPHLLTSDQLAAAWGAHRAGRFRLETLRPPAAAPDLAVAVRASIATTTAHLTGPVLGNAFDVNVGLSGMERLLADLEDTTTKKGWRRRFGPPEAFGVGMTRLAECLTWAHTAPGAGRSLYGAFLEEAGPITGLELASAAEAARDAGSQWAGIADVAAAATQPDVTIPDLADRVRSVLGVERRLVSELQHALAAG